MLQIVLAQKISKLKNDFHEFSVQKNIVEGFFPTRENSAADIEGAEKKKKSKRKSKTKEAEMETREKLYPKFKNEADTVYSFRSMSIDGKINIITNKEAAVVTAKEVAGIKMIEQDTGNLKKVVCY